MIILVIIIVYWIFGLFYATACEVFGERHHDSIFYIFLCRKKDPEYGILEKTEGDRSFIFVLISILWLPCFIIMILIIFAKWFHNFVFDNFTNIFK